MASAGGAAPGGRGGFAAVLGVAAGAAALMLLSVAMALGRGEPPVFAVTPPRDRPAGNGLVGPELVTVDATDAGRWVFYSFDRGSVVDAPGPRDWDLAFRRFQVVANGGTGFAGRGGVADLGDLPFDAVDAAPDGPYVENEVRGDTVNAALDGWYDYSFLSHLLSPAPRVFAVRTADGRFAKLEFVGYYCPGATPGCVTFRSVFQADGTPRLVAP